MAAEASGGSSSDQAFRDLVERVRGRVLRERPQLLFEAPGPDLRRRLEAFVAQVIAREGMAGPGSSHQDLVQAICAEMVGLGPIDSLLEDEEVTEIMVNGPEQIFMERAGRIEPYPARFWTEEHLLETVNRIVAPLGRRVDPAQPFVDARLPSGDRVHAIVPPLAPDGPVLTIRRFRRRRPDMEELVKLGTLTAAAARYLVEAVRCRRNVLVCGATSSGKTSTLIALLRAATTPAERIITLEEAIEIDLGPGRHLVRLEARPPGADGRGAVPLRTLLRNALRMRPDRLVVGEVRGEEAFDLMQALNTGHSGSVCTIHANGPLDALRRLEQLVLMAGEGVPATFVREQVYRAIHVLVHQVRLPDGRRVVREIVEVDADHRRLRPVPGCEPPAGAAPAGHGGAVRETGAGEGRGP